VARIAPLAVLRRSGQTRFIVCPRRRSRRARRRDQRGASESQRSNQTQTIHIDSGAECRSSSLIPRRIPDAHSHPSHCHARRGSHHGPRLRGHCVCRHGDRIRADRCLVNCSAHRRWGPFRAHGMITECRAVSDARSSRPADCHLLLVSRSAAKCAASSMPAALLHPQHPARPATRWQRPRRAAS
jgi:hypothetical protein